MKNKIGCVAGGLVFLVIVGSCMSSDGDEKGDRAAPQPTVTVTEKVEVEATETVEVEVTVTATETVRETVPAEPAPEPRQPAPQPAPAAEYYENCAAARAAGAAPVLVGEPGYGRHLDRDGDGVGCE